MLAKLRALLAGPAAAPSSPKPPPPFEVLVPEERPPPEQPQMAAKVLSCLFAAAEDVTTLELERRSAASSNAALREFLTLVAGAKKIETFVAHCKSIMFQSDDPAALGALCCIDRAEKLHKFTVYQVSPLPKLKWEIRRRVLEAQQAVPADGFASRARG